MAGHKVGESIGLLILLVGVILFVRGYTSPACGQVDDLVLAPLGNLHLDVSQGGQQLFNKTYVAEVGSSFGNTIAQILPQTITSYLDASAQMRNLSLQWMQNPPAWVNLGVTPVIENAYDSLFADIGLSADATQAAGLLQNFAASVAGYSLAALDFVSFNGVTAVQQYIETGNADLALCLTFPAQIAQLYKLSFDSTVPSDLRAHYLGQAIAITTIMVVLGGKDGFSAKFSDALDSVGLSDSWSTVKPYLYDIGAKVSADASAAVLSILQAVASHFPQDPVWATGLTADRIDAMVNTIDQNGASEGTVQNDIQHLVQASSNPSAEDSVADSADALSYQDGGGIKVSVRYDNHMVLYDDSTGRTQSISVAFLAQEIPGFDPDGPDIIQIHYHEAGITVYHFFPPRTDISQTNWSPVAPESIASPGDKITISFDLLTQGDFLQKLTALGFDNEAGANWVSEISSVTAFQQSGDQIQINFLQYPEIEDVSSFSIEGTVGPLQWVGGDTFVTITVQDLVNEPEILKFTFDGYGSPSLSFKSGSNFNQVLMISSDGVRLRVVYDSGGSNPTTATIYVQDPSALYKLGDMTPGSNYGVQSVSNAYQIQDITMNRQLELTMLNYAGPGSNYVLGRLGAEIAYAVGEQKLGLANLQLNEPSQGGADLMTGDGTTIIQARFLNMGNPSQEALNSAIQQNLVQMTDKLQTDFGYQDGAKAGYVILSYYTVNGGIQTIILEVPRPLG